MDVAQVILIVAVSILTAILTLVGFEVFLIFREIHQAVRKINQILEEAVNVSGLVSKQITNVSELLTAVKTTFDLAKVFFKKEEKEEKEKGKEENLLLQEGPGDGHSEENDPSITSQVRRFFTRAGKKLSSFS